MKVDPNGDDDDYVWTLNGEPMPVVTESMHVGYLRSANTELSAVNENIKKARRTLYSLMPSGLSWSQWARSRNDNSPITNVCSSGSYLWV